MQAADDFDGRGTLSGRIAQIAGWRFSDHARTALGLRAKTRRPSTLPIRLVAARLKIVDRTAELRDQLAHLRTLAKACGWRHEIILERLALGFSKKEIASQLQVHRTRVSQMISELRSLALSSL